MSYLIDHQCPQCGAPAILKETERLFSCEFCRVRSYLLGGKYFRYVFEPREGISQDIVYVPYWRFKGMMFSSSLQGIDHRIIDISTLAVSAPHFPSSVGLRSQALKLKFINPKTNGTFLKPTVSLGNMLKTVEQRSFKKSGCSAFVGDNLSLLYSPFYMEDRIYDAILDKPISSAIPSDFQISAENTETPNWPIRFIPVLCPDCGWDLEGERDSLTLNCRNCRSSWLSTEKGLLKLKFGLIISEKKNVLYLPFWRIKANISGMNLSSYKDLIRRANLPKAIQKGMELKPFYFWVQAFKVRPKIFLRLTRKLTLAQPDQEMTCDFPNSSLHPVTLPVTEAVESLKICLTGFVRPVKDALTRLAEIEITPKRFKLVYLPFYEDHHEFIQPDYHLTINKNMLSMAKNL